MSELENCIWRMKRGKIKKIRDGHFFRSALSICYLLFQFSFISFVLTFFFTTVITTMELQDIFNPKFQSVNFVGKGSFGVIASVTCINNGESRAIKLVDSSDRNVIREIDHLTHQQHVSIVRYFGTSIGSTHTLDDEWQYVLQRNI